MWQCGFKEASVTIICFNNKFLLPQLQRMTTTSKNPRYLSRILITTYTLPLRCYLWVDMIKVNRQIKLNSSVNCNELINLYALVSWCHKYGLMRFNYKAFLLRSSSIGFSGHVRYTGPVRCNIFLLRKIYNCIIL